MKNHYALSVIIALLLAVAPAVLSAKYVDLITSHDFGTWSEGGRISLDGDYAYVVGSGCIRVIDVSNKFFPHQVGLYSIQNPNFVVVRNGLGYASSGNRSIVLDASDPTQPDRAAILDSVGGRCGEIVGDLIFYGRRDSHLMIYRCDRPEDPVLLGECLLPGFPWNMTIDDRVAFIACDTAGVAIVDVSDLSAPFVASTYPLSGPARSITCQDRTVYTRTNSRTYSVDAEDIANPVLIDSSEINQGDTWSNMVVENEKLFVNSFYFSVQNVNDRFRTMFQDIYHFNDFVIRDSILYTSGGMFRVVDLHDLAAPRELGRISSYRAYFGVALRGEYAYTESNYTGLSVWDVGDIAHPQIVWREPYYMPNWYGGDILIDGNLLVLAQDSAGSRNSWLRIANLDDPAHPRWISNMPMPRFARRITKSGNIIYWVGSSGEAILVDVSDPDNPRELNLLRPRNAGEHITAITKVGNYAYAAVRENGLLINDVTDPLNIVSLGPYNPGDSLNGIMSKEDTLYLCSQRGLEIVNASDPENLQPIGEYTWRGGTANNVSLAGMFAITGSATFISPFQRSDNWLRVVNLNDPTHPRLNGYFDSHRVLDVATIDSVAFIADTLGFFIVNCARAMRENLPRWTIFPDDIQADSGSVVRFIVDATGEDVEMYYLWNNPTHREGASFRMRDDGTGEFYWRYNGVGHFEPKFVAFDGLNRDTLTIRIDYVTPNSLPSDSAGLPLRLELSQIAPNPFNSSTTINYTLPGNSRYALEILDISGRLVARLDEGIRPAGSYRAVWDAREAGSGTYFVRLQSDGRKAMQSINLVK